ncbi:MAG: type 2 isopentenyl-diphosphate Delta-isomerase [Acholeplasmataceae bacterium]|nr:type 2 isopentenyl-diphosphate Delta-isomerase [Acholeplasmataceae bacterium]
MSREKRKAEHILLGSVLPPGPLASGFDDVSLMHDCMPDLGLKDVSIATAVAGLKLMNPLIINAITGGSYLSTDLNRQIAGLAAASGCAMAVGSQYGAVRRDQNIESFKVVRKFNPRGIVFANMSAKSAPEEMRRAVEMLEADALQIHLNVAQEIVMPEGDRDFSGYLKNIEAVCQNSSVPVIVKETGCGICAKRMAQLIDVGVKLIDIGGAGGTNFLAIEAARRSDRVFDEILGWGIPTVITILETRLLKEGASEVIASGGIASGLDMAKALALGASAVGMAGCILRKILEQGFGAALEEIKSELELLRNIMLLTGASRVSELKKVPLLFKGETYQQLACRGHDLRTLAQRR